MSLTWHQIKRQLMADKRKLMAAALLGGIAMLLWGRLLIRDVPRTAVADPKADNTQAFLINPDEPNDLPVKATSWSEVRVVMADRVTHDLFHFQADYFPQDQTTKISDGAGDKSLVQTTDQDQHQRHVQAIRLAARSLKLQSTLLGADNRALINGELLNPGQRINGFELIDVGPRQVTLRRDGVEVVLEMGE